MRSHTEIQHGYRTPDGRNHRVTEVVANEGYMSAEEYARKRAEVTGGQYVRRHVATTEYPWEPTP